MFSSSLAPPFAFHPQEHSKFFIRRGNHSPISHTLPICKCHRGVGMCVCVCVLRCQMDGGMRHYFMFDCALCCGVCVCVW